MQDVLQGEAPTAESIGRLPFCEAILLESMRVLPPAYMVGRCAAEDAVLGGGKYQVAKGTTMLVAPYLLHTHPRLWEDPLSFKPQRCDLRGDGRD